MSRAGCVRCYVHAIHEHELAIDLGKLAGDRRAFALGEPIRLVRRAFMIGNCSDEPSGRYCSRLMM